MAEQEVVQNAVIESVSLETTDRGCLESWLSLKLQSGGGQGFGGYALYLPKSWTHHRVDSPAGHFIFRVMEIAGVTRWQDLVGKAIRIRGTHSQISAIGHIVKDDWFCPAEDFKRMEAT